MRTLTLIAAAFAALALASAASTMAPAGGTIQVHNSRFGPVLFDGRGFVLYAFTKDARTKSNCAGACAKAWPPYTVKSAPHAAKGVTMSLLGTTKRADGTLQVTYAGRPLYYYVGDRSAGQISCQNVSEYGGLWLVVRASGKLVR
jgi:predicted lipoprotein with Yx(FWY)xxD motif